MAKDRMPTSQYSRSRRRLKRHFKAYEAHHIYPRSRGGSDRKYNLFPWESSYHDAWHTVFRHMTIREVWEKFDLIWLAVFETEKENVIPKWWQVCPFPSRETHIPFTPVEVIKFQEAWFKCFGTEKLEYSRNLARLMLLFFIFDGILYDPKVLLNLEGPKNRKWLRRIIVRIRPDTPRHWAFVTCFGEEPSGEDEQINHIIRTIRRILAGSPYVPAPK